MRSIFSLPARLHRPVGFTFLLLIFVLLFVGESLLNKGRLNATFIRLNHGMAHGDVDAVIKASLSFDGLKADPLTGKGAWYGLAIAQTYANNPIESIDFWVEVENAPTMLKTWANQEMRQGDLAGSREWYLLLVNIEPENGDLWYELARVTEELDGYRARDYYLHALNAQHHTVFGKSNILTRLGDVERLQENIDWPQVLAYYDEAIQQDDFIVENDFNLSRLGRAEALERLGQLDASLEQYRALIEVEPNLYWANLHAGRLTWYLQRDSVTAAAYLQKAIEINDKLKWAYLNLGIVFANSGEPELALSMLEKTLLIDEDDSVARDLYEQLTSQDEER